MWVLVIYALQFESVNLRIDGQQKLSLMGSNSGGRNTFDQFGVLVNQPSFTQNVGCRIFQLKHNKEGLAFAFFFVS